MPRLYQLGFERSVSARNVLPFLPPLATSTTRDGRTSLRRSLPLHLPRARCLVGVLRDGSCWFPRPVVRDAPVPAFGSSPVLGFGPVLRFVPSSRSGAAPVLGFGGRARFQVVMRRLPLPVLDPQHDAPRRCRLAPRLHPRQRFLRRPPRPDPALRPQRLDARPAHPVFVRVVGERQQQQPVGARRLRRVEHSAHPANAHDATSRGRPGRLIASSGTSTSPDSIAAISVSTFSNVGAPVSVPRSTSVTHRALRPICSPTHARRSRSLFTAA